MNPALIILVPLALVVLWFLSSFTFKPIGIFVYRVVKNAMDEMNKEYEEEKENDKE